MKYIIISFLLCIFIYPTAAKEGKWLLNWDKHWNIYEAEMSVHEKEELIIKSGFNLKSLFFTENPVKLDSLIDYFHPIYLNEDDLVDFIYNGTDGSGGDLTAVILNSGGKLITMRKFFATVSNFIYRYPFSPSYMILTEYGCCGFLQQFKYDVVIVPHKDSLHINEGEKLCFHKFTGFPELYTMNKPVQLIKDSPSYKSLNFRRGKEGELLCNLKKGEKGFALAEGHDPAGAKYYFCILFNNTEKDGDCFLRTEDFEFYGKYFAWIPAHSINIKDISNIEPE